MKRIPFNTDPIRSRCMFDHAPACEVQRKNFDKIRESHQFNYRQIVDESTIPSFIDELVQIRIADAEYRRENS